MLDELAARTGKRLSQVPDLTVRKAASELGLSVSALYARWGADMTPKEFITQLRLAQVKAALAKGDQKIRDIAWEFRFCDHYYFSKWFKNLVGVAPKQYQLHLWARRCRQDSGRRSRNGMRRARLPRRAHKNHLLDETAVPRRQRRQAGEMQVAAAAMPVPEGRA